MFNSVLESKKLFRRVANKVRPPLPLFILLHRADPKFECPLCGYRGPFATMNWFGGRRKYAICPNCDSYERHRLQYVALARALQGRDLRGMKVLHFAPEKCLRPFFASVDSYETADLFEPDVTHKVDIRHLPFQNASYDLVFASHVLEHIKEDGDAIREVRRILKPKGMAILPVPVVCEMTIEYPAPNPYEAGHVRAPGIDYFDRYRQHFSKVEIFTSQSFDEKFQVFTYEDRSRWPTPECPLRPPMQGKRHLDYVPICFA
jgi:SAM-dependent methyltransferase